MFVARLELLSYKIFHILFECLIGYRFDDLIICALGDFVSGIIHSELVETASRVVTEQALHGAFVLAQFLREQATRFKRVKFLGVSGNHGRLTKEKRYKNRFADWDRILYETLALILRDQKNVSFHLSDAPFYLFEVNGTKFLMEHGDEIRRWMGMPWYGLERERIRKRELLEGAEADVIVSHIERRQEQAGSFTYMLLGHFHQCAVIDTPKGEMLVNGSFVGGSEHSIIKYSASCRPTQMLFGVNEEGMISFRFPLRLDTARESKRYLIPRSLSLAERLGELESSQARAEGR